MSTPPRQGHPVRDGGYLRVAIFSKERELPRKVAWLTAGRDGISIGVARGPGRETSDSYRTNGGFYRSIPSQTPTGPKAGQELVAMHPPLSQIRGLLHLLSVDSPAGDRLGRFPFKRRFESVYVRPLNGRAAFKLGLLEPGVPQALDTIRKEERHFRLITRTEPWMLLWNSAGFDTPSVVR